MPGTQLALLRPLLGWRREELAGIVARSGLEPAQDPSNDDPKYDRARIRELAWQHAGSREVMEPVSLADLQAGLGPDTAVVAYVVANDRVVALVVTVGFSLVPIFVLAGVITK